MPATLGTLTFADIATIHANHGSPYTEEAKITMSSLISSGCVHATPVPRLEHRLGRVVLAMHVDDGIGGASSKAILDWVYEEISKRGFKFSQRGKWEITNLLHAHVTRSAPLPSPRTHTDRRGRAA